MAAEPKFAFHVTAATAGIIVVPHLHPAKRVSLTSFKSASLLMLVAVEISIFKVVGGSVVEESVPFLQDKAQHSAAHMNRGTIDFMMIICLRKDTIIFIEKNDSVYLFCTPKMVNR